MTSQSLPPAANPGLKNEWWAPRLGGPVILAAVVRFGLLAVALARTGEPAVRGTDTSSYLIPGQNLLFHGAFYADGVPALLRTPAYPLFLAITGLGGLALASVVNVLLSIICLVLVWRLAKAVSGNDRLAIYAAWLMAIEPLTIVFSILLLSETLFMAFFLYGMERLAWFFRTQQLRLLAVAGVTFALAAFVRPAAYYLPVALAIGLVVVLIRQPGLRWKAPAVLLISCLPWLAAWQIRNKVETGYGGFSSARELNLYFTNGVEITTRLQHRNYFDVQQEFGYFTFVGHSGQTYLSQPYLNHHPEQAGWTQAQRIAFMGQEGSRLIRAHPGIYIRTLVSPLIAMNLEPGAGYFGRMLSLEDNQQLSNGVGTNEGAAHYGASLVKNHPGVAASKAVFLLVLLAFYLLALLGIVRGSIENPYLALLLGTAFYFIGLCGVTGGPGYDPRFRIPVLPIVCIFAAAGLLRKKTAAP